MTRKVSEIKTSAKESLKGNLGTSFLAEIAGDAISAVSHLIPFAGCIISGPLMVGTAGIYTKNTDHEKPAFKDLFRGFTENFGENFLLGLLKGLFIALWSLLLIIPGIIKGYAYAMSEYLMVRERDLTAMEAMKRSQILMKGHKMQLFVLELSFIGWVLITILTLGIASIYTVPYMKTAKTEFFNDIYYAA